MSSKMSGDIIGGERGRLMVTVGTQTEWTGGDGRAKHAVTVGTQTDGIGAGRGRLTVTVDTVTNKRICRFAEQSDQLLPGIPDEISLSEIAPKLPWSAIRTLSAVSRHWLQAIRTRQAPSTETLVVLNEIRAGGASQDKWAAISLYSMRDDRLYALPRLPFLSRGIPPVCTSVSLDGKIYVIGGHQRKRYIRDEDPLAQLECEGVEMYVLDVSGKEEWKQCASMQDQRKQFGCGVINGKIYVFGGSSGASPHSHLNKSEVYDPEADTWSSIEPMRTLRAGHSVTAIGEELVIYGGLYQDTDQFGQSNYYVPQFLEIYHPIRNEWRMIQPFGRDMMDKLFMAQGKFHSMTLAGMSVHDYDIHRNVWTDTHSFSLLNPDELPSKPPSYGFYLEAHECPVLAVGDELLTISQWYNSVTDTYDSCLLRSEGFCRKKKELLWQKANCPIVWNMLEHLYPPSLCSLQL